MTKLFFLTCIAWCLICLLGAVFRDGVPERNVTPVRTDDYTKGVYEMGRPIDECDVAVAIAAKFNLELTDVLDVVADVDEAPEFTTARNELCYKCGAYAKAHLGACDGCRWRH